MAAWLLLFFNVSLFFCILAVLTLPFSVELVGYNLFHSIFDFFSANCYKLASNAADISEKHCD